MDFGVLGPLSVRTADGAEVPVPGLKVRVLLAVLLAEFGQPVPADRLVDALWGEQLPGDPAGTLSGKVTQLRRAMDRAEPGARRLVVSPPPGYRLLADAEAVDAGRFRRLVAEARASAEPRTRAGLLADALGLWRGPAFADFAGESFAELAAARLTEERLSALEEYAETRLALGEHAGLVAELAEHVVAHPLRERLRAVQIRALYRAGRPGEALRSYEELRTRLADELGLDPGPELVALHRAVLARAEDGRRTNLPAVVSELIGREDAVAAIRDRVLSDRLVTLTGTGGVGKTRLALAAATVVEGNFSDGVRLVELAALQPGSAERIDEVVLAALDVRDVLGAVEALRSRNLLLVLDNCEHVIEPAAELAGRLLRECPGLHLLATSREPLGLPGEVVWAVPPLDVPVDGAQAERSAAVRLVAARAEPGFVLTPETVPAVAELCRRLDGIPLALELAATRLRAFGVQELVARLDDRFRLLADGRRDAPARQRTLRGAIDWSWDLLTEPERVVLRRLAVHADGCTLEAAEHVCADPGDVPRADVAALVSRLVDRCLVTVLHGPDGSRYRLLESVAAYCMDRLAEAGETGSLHEAHVRYYARLASRAELYGHEQRRWLHRLDAETANLHVALGNGTAAQRLTLVNDLVWYWFLRGRLTEARRSLRAALEHGGPGAARARAWLAGIEMLLGLPVAERDCDRIADPAHRARAEWFLAYAEIDLGEVAAVDERLDRALTGFRDGGDRWGIAAVLSTRAKLGYLRADQKAIERDGERSAELFGELGERWGLLQATGWLGGLAEMTGDHDKATRLHREGLRLATELGLWTEVSVRLGWLGWIAVQQADYAQALELSGEALRLATEQGFRVGEVFARIGVAYAARRLGDLDEAERHLAGILRAADPGEPPPLHLSMVLVELGFIAELRGDAGEARRMHLRALAVARELDQPRGVAMALEGLAGAAAAAGEAKDAARLLGAAAPARRAASVPAARSERAEIDRIAAAVRAVLGTAGFDAAYRDGAP